MTDNLDVIVIPETNCYSAEPEPLCGVNVSLKTRRQNSLNLSQNSLNLSQNTVNSSQNTVNSSKNTLSQNSLNLSQNSLNLSQHSLNLSQNSETQTQRKCHSRQVVYHQAEPKRLSYLQTQLQRFILGYDDFTTPFNEQRDISSGRNDATTPYVDQRHGNCRRDDAGTPFCDLRHGNGRSVDATTHFSSVRHCGGKCDDTTARYSDRRQGSGRNDDASTPFRDVYHHNGRSYDATQIVSNSNCNVSIGPNADICSKNSSKSVAQDVIISYPFINKQTSHVLNPNTFNLNTKGARFFILKSPSEDLIRHSITHGTWNGTSDDGNNRLNLAVHERQGKGPIILFFSVTGSGCLSGVAQMTSAVEYGNDVCLVYEGSVAKGEFKIRWIYVKDVPDDTFWHVLVEDTERVPVTCCSDTEEIPPYKGRRILHIVHAFQHTSSMLDTLQSQNGEKESACVARGGPREGNSIPVVVREKLVMLEKEIERFYKKSTELDNLYKKRRLESRIMLVADVYASLLDDVPDSDTPYKTRVRLRNDLQLFHDQVTTLDDAYAEKQRDLKLAPVFSRFIEGVYYRGTGSQLSRLEDAINKFTDINADLDRLYRKECQISPSGCNTSDTEKQGIMLMEGHIRKLRKPNHFLRHRLKEISHSQDVQGQTSEYQ